MINEFKRYISCIMFLMIGISSWMIVNCIYVQIPVLIDNTEYEKNTVASRLSIAVQLSNIVPSMYMIYRLKKASKLSSSNEVERLINDEQIIIEEIFPFSLLVFLLITIATIISILLMFFYDATVEMNSEDIYLYLYIFIFIGGAIGGISNLTYWSMTVNDANLTVFMAIGIGFSGVIPSIIALIQKPGGHHERFNSHQFFLIHVILLFISCLAALHVVLYPHYHYHHKNQYLLNQTNKSSNESSKLNNSLHINSITDEDEDEVIFIESQIKYNHEYLSYGSKMVMNFIISSIFFFLPGASTFLLDGFNDYDNILLAWLVIFMLGGTLGRFVCLFIKGQMQKSFIYILVLVQLVGFIFICIFSKVNSSSYITLISLGFVSVAFGITNTMIYKSCVVAEDIIICNQTCNRLYQSQILGFVEQVAAFTGAVASFLLTNV